MTGMLGADPGELRRLSAWCRQQSRVVAHIQADLNGRVHTAPWTGRKAEEFRARWNSYYSRWLRDSAVYLEAAAGVLLQNAEQQEQASSVAGGTVLAGFVAGAAGHMVRPVMPNPHHSLFGSVFHAFQRAEQEQVKSVEAGLHELDHLQHEVVQSRAFQDFVSFSHAAGSVLSVAAPVLALIPVTAPLAAGLMVAAVAFNALATEGDVAEMADHVKRWDPRALADDGVALISSAIPAAEGLKMFDTASVGVREAVNITDAATRAYNLDENSYEAGVDIANHRYLDAAGHFVDAASSGLGSDHSISSIPADDPGSKLATTLVDHGDDLADMAGHVTTAAAGARQDGWDGLVQGVEE